MYVLKIPNWGSSGLHDHLYAIIVGMARLTGKLHEDLIEVQDFLDLSEDKIYVFVIKTEKLYIDVIFYKHVQNGFLVFDVSEIATMRPKFSFGMVLVISGDEFSRL